ncbi:helix-turn-helix domain-containing protein [Actinotalea subterranea]|uniref:helix-turn-helix domain-containing protein n=1 Tax=Actinotalea subterranea TaxID=2607497 RepID=UPI0011F04240|nr:helix-turn-helix domain-containing protein [Actinotalea subterranea]
MRELLQRLSALDEDASAAVKIITYFDTLLRRKAGLEPFVRGAAVLSGWPAGFAHPLHQLWIRVDPSGNVAPAVEGVDVVREWPHLEFDDGSGALVWIERPGGSSANDMVTLERLSAGLRLTLERVSPVDLDDAGAVEILVSATSTDDSRRKAARRLRLPVDRPLRVVVAPPDEPMPDGMRSTLVESSLGTIRAGVAEPTTERWPARCGVGTATSLHGLPQSFAQALVAVRLVSRLSPVVHWDELGVLGPFLTAAEGTVGEHPDLERVAALAAEPWGLETLEALAATDSVRAAAQVLGLHHSTLQSRLTRMQRDLGFDVTAAHGRHRALVALSLHRLRTVRFAATQD